MAADIDREFEFFSQSVKITDSCWLWEGYLHSARTQYGYIKINRKRYLAHRLAYELFKGQIPHDKEIDHLCRNHQCVNPTHLEAVTHAENIRRGFNVGRPRKNERWQKRISFLSRKIEQYTKELEHIEQFVGVK